MENKRPTPEEILAGKTRRAFVALGIGGAAAVGGFAWLVSRPEVDGIPGPFRKAFAFNEGAVRNALYSNNHLAPTFPVSAVTEQKSNGMEGQEDELDGAWQLEVGDRKLSLEDLKTLPRVEQTTEFKCVEGWSAISRFAGARLADFTAKFAPGGEKSAYVGMKTPDGLYYVGLDMPSAMHPQTLLAWEMNGEPLTDDHGAPLRLVIPVKYGIKNIKRIGKIWYSSERPADYWAERGYDYYSGL